MIVPCLRGTSASVVAVAIADFDAARLQHRPGCSLSLVAIILERVVLDQRGGRGGEQIRVLNRYGCAGIFCISAYKGQRAREDQILLQRL